MAATRRVTIEEFAKMFYAEYSRQQGTRAEFFNFARKHGIAIPFIVHSASTVPAGQAPIGNEKYYQIPVPVEASPSVSEFLEDLQNVPEPETDNNADAKMEEEIMENKESNVVLTKNEKAGRAGASKTSAPKENLALAPAPKIVIGNSAAASETFIPKKDANFIPWGVHSDIEEIIKSGLFYPVYNTGLSGCGKTEGIMQACARARRECIRVNITAETDEDDLIGGFRLINGETVWVDGPVVEAAQRGAILLLDEIDLATPRIMALQPVLEGKPFFIKKIGKYIFPAPGFNVLATANTKGKGSATGHFVGTNFLNEAFLDRFAITLEHTYPTPATEKRILSKFAVSLFACSISDKENQEVIRLVEFIGCLVDWAAGIRKNFEAGTSEEVITTRRLLDIIKTYKIFGKIGKAVKYGIARFDAENQVAFATYYAKIDPRVDNNLDDIKSVNTVSKDIDPFANNYSASVDKKRQISI